MKDPDLKMQQTPDQPASMERFKAPSLQLDPEDYREELAEFGLTDQQEIELLEVLWSIMSSFVAIGYGLDSVQLFSTEEKKGLFEIAGPDSGNMPDIKNTPRTFNQAVRHSGSKEE